jgi:hypothetical protein
MAYYDEFPQPSNANPDEQRRWHNAQQRFDDSLPTDPAEIRDELYLMVTRRRIGQDRIYCAIRMLENFGNPEGDPRYGQLLSLFRSMRAARTQDELLGYQRDCVTLLRDMQFAPPINDDDEFHISETWQQRRAREQTEDDWIGRLIPYMTQKLGRNLEPFEVERAAVIYTRAGRGDLRLMDPYIQFLYDSNGDSLKTYVENRIGRLLDRDELDIARDIIRGSSPGLVLLNVDEYASNLAPGPELFVFERPPPRRPLSPLPRAAPRQGPPSPPPRRGAPYVPVHLRGMLIGGYRDA